LPRVDSVSPAPGHGPACAAAGHHHDRPDAGRTGCAC